MKKGKQWIKCRHSELDDVFQAGSLCESDHLCVEKFPECTRALSITEFRSVMSRHDPSPGVCFHVISKLQMQKWTVQSRCTEKKRLREKRLPVLIASFSCSQLRRNVYSPFHDFLKTLFSCIIYLTWNKKGMYYKCLKASISYNCLWLSYYNPISIATSLCGFVDFTWWCVSRD